jgi:hypothetical protein
MTRALIAVILQLVTPTVIAAEETPIFSLIFPAIQLDPNLNQAMEEISFTVACGHIVAVGEIPDLWNVEIDRATSVVETFRASAGLGTARLTKPDKWSNAIVIKEVQASCFKLSGSIIIGGEKYLELPLSNTNLRRVQAHK